MRKLVFVGFALLHLSTRGLLAATPTEAMTVAVPAPRVTSDLDTCEMGDETEFLIDDPLLASVIEDVLGEEIGSYGIVVKELRGGTGVAINSERVFYAASLFKLAVMHEAFRQREAGRLDFAETIAVTEEDVEFDLGTLAAEVGDEISVERLIELMITVSDNTAAIMLLHRLGNRNVDAGVAELGLRNTSVNTEDLPTSAVDMAILLEAIATGQAVSPGASEEMALLLLAQHVRGRIPAGVPPDVPVANKTGDWVDAVHDVAIVYAPSVTYLLVALSDNPLAHSRIVELSRRVYEHYSSFSGTAKTARVVC